MKVSSGLLSLLFISILLFITLDGRNTSAKEKPSKIGESVISLPSKEKQIISQVADKYGLKGKARALLYIIRKIENGPVGCEFGVKVPEAMRYKNNPTRSFWTQAEWAAGTIRKRWNGNIDNFADRWCPYSADPQGNINWKRNAKFYMKKWEKYF